jgi:hypothetical protein
VRNKVLTIVGIVLIILGIFWALQGFGEIGGGPMSGNSAVKVIGPVVALIGLVLTAIGLRRARSV